MRFSRFVRRCYDELIGVSSIDCVVLSTRWCSLAPPPLGVCCVVSLFAKNSFHCVEQNKMDWCDNFLIYVGYLLKTGRFLYEFYS